MGHFERRHILVTGGGSGIGLATVERLHAQGAVVTVFDRSAPAIESVQSRFAGDVRVFQGDALSEEDIVGAVDVASSDDGVLDGVFGNAGVPGPQGVSDLTADDWSRVMGVNVTALGLLTKHARPALKKSDAAAVVFTASAAGLIALGSQPSYTASKGAVVALTRALGNELGPDGIRVNSVAPGFIDTPMLRDFFAQTFPDEAEREAQMAASQASLPPGRFGRPGEIADAVVYLLGGTASYITGVTLAVDGGLSSMK